MIDTVYIILLFIAAIVILVTVHELGHYLAAVWTKTRAEIFSVGMGRRLFGWNRLDGFTFGNIDPEKDYGDNTDWRVSLLPIGGYVKIAGMVDESMDTDTMQAPPQPWEFRSKKAWQKVFILSAGVIFNFLLAIALFFSVSFFFPRSYFDTDQIGYVDPYGKAHELGFRRGDRVLSVNGEKPRSFQDIFTLINRDDVGEDRAVKILRANGSKETISISYDSVLVYMAAKDPIRFDPAGYLVTVQDIAEGMNASKTSLKKGDTLYSVKGIELMSATHLSKIVSNNPNSDIVFVRSKEGGRDTLVIPSNEDGKVGIMQANNFTGDISYHSEGFFTSLAFGWNASIDMIDLFFESIEQIFAGSIDAKDAVGGPIMIAKQAALSAEIGFDAFLSFLASLSVSLAIINILPLPVLDGGHIIIVLVERIRGRELSESVKLRIQSVGMVMMFLLMALIIYVDLTR